MCLPRRLCRYFSGADGPVSSRGWQWLPQYPVHPFPMSAAGKVTGKMPVPPKMPCHIEKQSAVFRLAGLSLFQHVQTRELATLLIAVQSVPDDESVGHSESAVVDLH